MIFPSKRDRFTCMILTGAFIIQIGVIVWSLIDSSMIEAEIVSFVAAVLILWIMFGTYYILTDLSLIIRCGPMRWTIRLNEIVEIIPTENLLKAPALSQDRLQIDYQRDGKLQTIMISPNDKADFLRQVASAQPRLELNGERLTQRA